MQQQNPEVVKIEVSGDKLEVDRPNLEVGNEDEIEWECGHPWALVFEPSSRRGRGKPFGEGPFDDKNRVRKKGQGRPNRGKVRAHKGKKKVHYKYTVACYKDGEVYIEDPEVIVDPSRSR